MLCQQNNRKYPQERADEYDDGLDLLHEAVISEGGYKGAAVDIRKLMREIVTVPSAAGFFVAHALSLRFHDHMIVCKRLAVGANFAQDGDAARILLAADDERRYFSFRDDGLID